MGGFDRSERVDVEHRTRSGQRRDPGVQPRFRRRPQRHQVGDVDRRAGLVDDGDVVGCSSPLSSPLAVTASSSGSRLTTSDRLPDVARIQPHRGEPGRLGGEPGSGGHHAVAVDRQGTTSSNETTTR